jgi:hypothetical protein
MAKQPRYTVEIEAEANGRLQKSTVVARGADGKTLARDRANLSSDKECRGLVKNLARQLGEKDTKSLQEIVEEKYLELMDQHRKFREQQQAGSAEGAAERNGHADPKWRPDVPYFEQNNRIFRRRYDRDGSEINDPLCNFACTIEAETIYDDGSGEVQHFFRIGGRLYNNEPLPAVDVPAGDFAAMNWPIKYWGVRAIVSPGQGAKDHLRAAVQELSSKAARRTVYRQTGWRQIDGQWLYLHAAGAIGPVGTVKTHTIDLPGNLSLIALPDPPDGEDLAACVRASLGILDLAHQERITAPVLGAVYRAPFGSTDFSGHLAGPTGTFKTELAALAEQHFGPGLDARHLPASWTSTANATETLAFTAADTLLIVDDFAPGGSPADVSRYHRDADRIFRAAGNHAGAPAPSGRRHAPPGATPTLSAAFNGRGGPQGT